jgi:antitoxin component of RelBE/YafQ-DinJ toxin-antitoxin module
MITEKDKINIHNAAQDIWNVIGLDVFEALKLEKELNPNSNTNAPLTMTQKDVIGMVLDAGRLDEHLKEQDQWVLGMENLSLDEWINLVKPAFPFDTYGK